jgi:hypothetical protein
MGRRIGLLCLSRCCSSRSRALRTPRPKWVFNSREYRAVGRSYPQLWVMTLPDRQKVEGPSDTCTRQPIESAVLPTDTRLPDRSEHRNYLTSVSASPDGKLVLVGSEAGSSTSHFEDYWYNLCQSPARGKHRIHGTDLRSLPAGDRRDWASAGGPVDVQTTRRPLTNWTSTRTSAMTSRT